MGGGSWHEGIRYPCAECDYAGTTVGNLKIHKESEHEGNRYLLSVHDLRLSDLQMTLVGTYINVNNPVFDNLHDLQLSLLT